MKRNSRSVESVLLMTSGLLLTAGLITLSSASTAQSVRLYDNPHEIIIKQIVWVVLGLILGSITWNFDYSLFKTNCLNLRLGRLTLYQVPLLTLLFFCFVLLALVLVYVPGIGLKINGSRRWLDFVVFRFQPSEFAKIAVIIAMSVWLDRIGVKSRTFKYGLVFSLLLLAPFTVLILCQVDLGATMVVAFLALTLMLVAGVRLAYLVPLGMLGIAGLAALIWVKSGNRLERIKAWFQYLTHIDIGAGTLQQGDHLRASLHAIQSGGLEGVGYTNSLEKLRYLPESHTDFIFPIGAEEFGLFFSLAVVFLFCVILICGVIISHRAADNQDWFGAYLAVGFTVMVVFPAMFNLAVVTGLAPTKGIALPFFSYGGTSVFSIMIAIGFLLNVAASSSAPRKIVKNSVVKI
ncbi:MAG: putative peptidoglycan glycosyltransferase FtsW [Kiritimatiellia bacterium]